MPKRRSSLEQISWVAGIISAVLALIALVYTFASSKSGNAPPNISQSATTGATQIGTVGGNVTIVNPSLPPVSSPVVSVQSKISKVFNVGIIDGSLDYVESIIGPAKRKFQANDGMEFRYYSFDGCELELENDKNSAITAIKLNISSTCTFNWQEANSNYRHLPPPNKIRFRDVMRMGGRWFVDCLDGCGNAIHNSIELHVGGGLAENGVRVVLGTIDTWENATVFSNLAEKIAKEKGSDFVYKGKYKCNYDLELAVNGVVDDTKITYVQFSNSTIIDDANREQCK